MEHTYERDGKQETMRFREPTARHHVDAYAERQAASSAFWTCELGRIVAELQERKDLPADDTLHLDQETYDESLQNAMEAATTEDRRILAQMTAAGMEETVALLEALVVDGTPVKRPDLGTWALRTRPAQMEAACRKLFGDADR